MLFKPRIALLGVLALFIASGIATSTASAGQGPFWHVNGSKLGQGAVKQVKFQLKFEEKFALKGKTLGGFASSEIKCHNGYGEGATIEGQGSFQGQDKGVIVFEQCKTTFKPAAPECHVKEPIKTNQIKSYLAYNGTKPENKQQKFVDVFEPQQGSKFVVLHFEGNGCLVAEGVVEGSVAAEVLPIEKESQELLFVFPEEPIETIVHEQQERKIGLIFGGEPAVLFTVFGARLATNETWGVFAQ
jgi:hypothetical protein